MKTPNFIHSKRLFACRNIFDDCKAPAFNWMQYQRGICQKRAFLEFQKKKKNTQTQRENDVRL